MSLAPFSRQFTPGARRVLEEAARWSRSGNSDGGNSDGGDSDGIGASSLLLGLLAETECRAAIVLARHRIDPSEVRDRWPDLEILGASIPLDRLSDNVQESLTAVTARLGESPEPLILATEHLLLGLAASEHEVGQWLRQKGICPDTLEAEICRQYGIAPLSTASLLPGEVGETIPLDLPPDVSPDITPEAGLDRICENAIPEPVSRTGRLPKAEQVRVFRVLDVAANRGREAIRVVEDYARFVLDDRHLTERLKQLRHDLAACLASIALGDRLAARETQADVGTELSTDSERFREDMAGVLAANFARFQESLRSLEEFGKLLDPGLAGQFERLRYHSYTLQRAIEITETSVKRLAAARLYVLTDGCGSSEQFEELARSLVEAGVHVIQLRDKWLDDRRLYERARLLRQITLGGDTLFIMNDRPDMATLVHADGVHVGQEELSVKDARTIVGPEALVGVSTHSIEQARRAVLDGADYLGVGPTFPSETKEFHAFPGLELLKAVADEIRLPAFAIGGITRKNLPEVLAAGARRIAVSRAVSGSEDPAATARVLLADLRG